MSSTSLPSQSDRSWLASVLGGDVRTLRVRRLTGGISSAVHDVAIADQAGKLQHYVLRRWATPDLPQRTADVLREADILTGLCDHDLPAPRLVAIDPEPQTCTYPSLLMTRLPGRMLLRPTDPEDWLRQLAQMLPRIHAARLTAPPAEMWVDPADLMIPPWSSDDGMWRAAFDLFHTPVPTGDECFIHRDYQQFNLLWSRQSLTGVVDWAQSSYGSPDIDVAHCRLNLTVVYSAEYAARFLELYEASAGRRAEPWWDVRGLLVYLPGWDSFLQRQAGRRLTIDFVGMHERVETTLRAALDRVG